MAINYQVITDGLDLIDPYHTESEEGTAPLSLLKGSPTWENPRLKAGISFLDYIQTPSSG